MIAERIRPLKYLLLVCSLFSLYIIYFNLENDSSQLNRWIKNTKYSDLWNEIPDDSDSYSSTTISYFHDPELHENVSESTSSEEQNNNENENVILLEDIEEADIRPDPSQSKRQIFFIETSHPEGANLELNERKACAIESAALNHPEYKIFVMIAGQTTINYDRNTSNTFKNLVENYPNVYFRSLDPFEFMKKTPLENFHKWKTMRTSKNYRVYLADILRLVAIWKYGGLYFDTDVVVLRNFEDLGENYLCVASYDLLMSGTMQFSSTGIGHEVVGEFLKSVETEFNARQWASNGPMLITRVMKRICQAKNTAKMNIETCKGIKILPKKTFLPVGYKQHWYYLKPNHGYALALMVKKAYTAHIFNHMNGHIKLKKSDRAGYVRLAENYCPHVYKNLGEYF